MKTDTQENFIKKLSERESKMYGYYTSVFQEGFEGGYPMEWDNPLLEELTTIATVTEERVRKEMVEEIRKEVNKRDTTTGFNAQYNDQFHEAKGYHNANLETIKYLDDILLALSNS